MLVSKSIRSGAVSELHDDVGLGEVGRRESERAEAEVVESRDQPARVVGIEPDPDVQVLREPRMPVRGERIASDDQEADVTRGTRTTRSSRGPPAAQP